MTKFTSGPWIVEEDIRDYGEGEYIAGFDIHAESGGEEIIGSEGINGDGETNRANAVLIAAAPDLLHALQNIENDNGKIPDHAWKVIQDAIAKATTIQ